MTGTSHKVIGVAVGAAFTIYGYQNGMPHMTLALVSAPIAAMLPDIDHNSSKMGRVRKTMANIAVTVAALAIAVAIWYYGFYLGDYAELIALGVGIGLPLGVLFALTRIKAVRNMIGFATMHRGIMHTLLLPICIFFASRFIADDYVLMLIYGGIAGYVSHIFADMITRMGCPVLFPITRRNINLTKIRTGSAMEKIIVAVIILIVLAIPFLLMR